MVTRKKVALVSLLLVLAFLLWGCGGGGGSWTPGNLLAIVIGVDSSYSTANLSTVSLDEEGFSISPSLISNLCGDTVVKTYRDYVFIVERPSWGTVDSPIYVYKVGEWDNPLKNYTLGKNVYDIVFVNESVAYAIPWGEAFIQKIKPLTGEEIRKVDLSSYSYGSDGSPNAAKGLFTNGRLFVILQRYDVGTFSYGEGKLIVINPNEDSIDRDITLNSKNPQDLDHYGGKLYIVQAGRLFDPSDDAIDVMDLRDYNLRKLCDNPLQEEGMDLYALEITENGTAYLLGGGWPGWPNYKVYEFDLRDGKIGGMIYEGGYITSIRYDSYSGYLFILDRGTGSGDGKLVIYDTEKKRIVEEIGEEKLGYPPYSIDIAAFD